MFNIVIKIKGTNRWTLIMNRLTKDQDIQVMELISVIFFLNETDVLQIWTKLFM